MNKKVNRNQETGFRKQTILLILSAFIPLSSWAAGWSTNAWPAYEHLRMGSTNIADLYTSIVERAEVLKTYYPVTPTVPTWYRFNRSLLVGYKNDVKKLLYLGAETVYTNSCWIDATVHPDGLQGVSTITNLDMSRLAQICHLPTNYLAYTPWRCLDGVGPFTNDATVGRPHGWTNSYTAAGGTNFSGSRTNWYTTDYGYDGLYLILNKLILYWKQADWRYPRYISDSTNLYTQSHMVQGSGPDYGTAAAACQSEWNAGWAPDDDEYIPAVTVFGGYLSVSEAAGTYYARTYSDLGYSYGPYCVKYLLRLTSGSAGGMSERAATEMLDKAEIYAYWRGSNVFSFAAGKYGSGSSYVLWESLAGGTTNLTGSTFFGAVTWPGSYFSYRITNEVTSQGVLEWFTFPHRE